MMNKKWIRWGAVVTAAVLVAGGLKTFSGDRTLKASDGDGTAAETQIETQVEETVM